MKKALRKRLTLTASFCCLLALFITLPAASGYGSNWNNATEISNGTTNEWSTTNGDIYYKICCNAGDNLSVTLIHYGGGQDLDLVLYHPNHTLIDGSYFSSINDQVNTTCAESGFHFVKVYPFAGTTPFQVTLIVSGATGTDCAGIPGFEVIPTLVGLIAATVLALMLLRSRKQILP